MNYVFCIMQTCALLTGLPQIYQNEPNLQKKSEGYREKWTGTGKNRRVLKKKGQVPGKMGKLQGKMKILPGKMYISQGLVACQAWA